MVHCCVSGRHTHTKTHVALCSCGDAGSVDRLGFIWPGHKGQHHYSWDECPGICSDHRESGPVEHLPVIEKTGIKPKGN